MKKLYDIVKLLQNTQGTKAKQAILDENYAHVLLREYLKAMLDPAINFYQTKISAKKGVSGTKELDLGDLTKIVGFLSNRVLTGDRAKKWLKELYEEYTPESQELLTYLIKGKIADAKVGEEMVLNTWNGLFFIPPYQRCSLLTAKIKAEFEKLQYFFVQTKLDGAFAYGINTSKREVMTRAGNLYPVWFADKLLQNAPDDSVFVGELLVYENGELKDRKTGNGILNSILQEGEEGEFKAYTFKMIAWDLLPYDDWSLGACDEPYCDRLGELEQVLESGNLPCIELVYSETVTSMQHAFEIYQDHLQRGEEGCIMKHPLEPWKDGTSKFHIKLKLKFPVDLKITGSYEGTGKAAGMLGGINLETSDGLLKTDCGSGFDDDTRKKLWAIRDQLPDKVVTVETNNVETRKGTDTKSLFLPVFIEIRNDKTVADSLPRVMEQLEAAKRGEL